MFFCYHSFVVVDNHLGSLEVVEQVYHSPHNPVVEVYQEEEEHNFDIHLVDIDNHLDYYYYIRIDYKPFSVKK